MLLQGLSSAYTNEQVLVFADSAGWHKSKDLEQPKNIHLELLPPYSPELNPAEHLRDYIRKQKGFNNHHFDSMNELEKHLEDVKAYTNNPKKITSSPYVPSTG